MTSRPPGGPDWPLDRCGRLLCRALLALAPPAFRRRFGAALLAAVALRADDLRRDGGTALTGRWWARQGLDLARAILAEWVDLLRPGREPSTARSPETQIMDDLRLDLVFAFRTLVRRPAMSTVVVLTLALAIGANTAIFSILDAVVLRPLPYEDPDRLVLFIDDFRNFEMSRAPLADYELRAFRESARSFSHLGATISPFRVTLNAEAAPPEQVMQSAFTPDFLEMLGVPTVIGRAFSEAEGRAVPQEVFEVPGTLVPRGVALLGHDFWRRRFGGDPGVLGRIVELGQREHEIVGVLPADFRLFWPADLSSESVAAPIDVYVPLEADIANATTGAGYLTVVGRLADGVSLEQAQSEIDAITARQRGEHERHIRLNVHTFLHRWSDEASRHVRPALMALLGAVGFVLLIACANVANLLVARAIERRQEIAIRSAIGAKRARILRQSLTESLVLAVLGGGLGVLFAHWGVRVLLTLQTAELPRADLIGISPSVALFTLGATVLAVLLFGTLPALVLAGSGAGPTLNDRGSAGGSVGRTRLRRGLVVLEVALSLVLLVGAGLTLRSFAGLQSVDLGFRPARVTTFQVQLPFFQAQEPESHGAFLQSTLTRLGALPGVESVGAGSSVPLGGLTFAGTFRTADMPADDPPMEANYRGASEGYFETLGVPVLAGRSFRLGEPDHNVVVIDQRLAETAFPDREAVGETLNLLVPDIGPPRREEVRIVGVVGNVRDDGLVGQNRRTIYFTHEFLAFPVYTFALRTRDANTDLVDLALTEIAAIDPELPVYDIRPLRAYVDDALAPTRFTLVLVSLFGVFALLLAAVGLYGVLAQSVREQTRDIGVRMAFGATSSGVLREVVGKGAMLAGVGALVGLAVAVPLTRALRSLFVLIEPNDPLTLAATTLLLLAVAVVACWLPARRAARMDPASSLRAD